MNRYKINIIKKHISTNYRYGKNNKNIVDYVGLNQFKFKKNGWLNDPILKNKIKKMEKENKINYNDFICISDENYEKPIKSLYFKKNIEKMGEHSISYMEKINNFKKLYEEINIQEKTPFINLTIGGVYRETPPRSHFSPHRGYISHIGDKEKEIVSKIFNSLKINIQPSQSEISPFRSKTAIQHAFGLFEKGIVIAHKPNYKSSVDSAKYDHGHTIVEVDVKSRYSGLFKEVRNQFEKNKNIPIILLLVCPQNPCAISMNDEEEKELHQLINDLPINIIHDIAYQDYNEFPRDAGKIYRDKGMPHKNQVYLSFLSTSKSIYASGQSAFYTADKNSLDFIKDHYKRIATGPTSTFVYDLEYYFKTLDNTYMRSVENKLQKPIMDYIDKKKKRWGVDYLIRPDGPPFITLDINKKLKKLNLTSQGFQELTLRLCCPVLVSDGILRIALTGFDKKTYSKILPTIISKLDTILSIDKNDKLLTNFIKHNPFYSNKFILMET